MSNFSRWLLPLALMMLMVQLGAFSRGIPPITNIHESVGEIEDIITLQKTMQAMGIQKTVLAAIPEAFLNFEPEKLSLDAVEESNALVKQVTLQTESEDIFDFLCAIDPLDVNRTSILQQCLAGGGSGVKMYNGYSYSHILPIDDSRLTELYAELEKQNALLMLPVNAGEYQSELENVLTLYPDLSVICPHYCLSSQSLNRLTDLMTRYPNLYIDTSFGSTDFAVEGFQTITDNNEAYRSLFESFQDRILFGTNNVVLSGEGKDEDFLKQLYQDYIWILTEGDFESALTEGLVYKGLELPYGIQQKVFWQNWANLVE